MYKINRFFLLCCAIFVLNGCCVFKKKPKNVADKQDWSVVVDPSTKKEKGEYDVIIIGAGYGGLSCGAILAQDGYKVLVLEQQEQVGGYASSFTRKGFTFPIGATDVSGCDVGAVKQLLDRLHLKKDDFFTLNSRTYLLDDKNIILRGTKENIIKELSALYPSEKEALFSFFNEAETAFQELYDLRKDQKAVAVHYQDWSRVSYQRKLDQFFSTPELKKLFASLTGYVGAPACEMQASHALVACLSYFIYGGYYPDEGGKKLAEKLTHIIGSHDGKVETQKKVDSILVSHNQVVGVSVGAEQFFSTIVVANANAKTVYEKLLPKGSLSHSFLKSLNKLGMSKSESVVHFGLDLDLSKYASLVRVETPKEKYSFCIHSNGDSSMAPRGKSSLSIGIPSLYDEVPLQESLEYVAFKDNLIEQALQKLEIVIPNIRSHILVTAVVTPRTYEKYTSMPKGAWYSFSQAKGTRRPYFKTPIKGLYLASSSTYPGGGVEAVVASGLICASDIEKGRKDAQSEAECELALPSPALKGSRSVEEAIKLRRSVRSFHDQPLTLSDLAQLLWAAQGVTHDQTCRSAPSAGGLYPIDTYVVVERVTGLHAGVYQYNPELHSLKKLLEGSYGQKICKAANSQECVGNAAVTIVLSLPFDRSMKKYGRIGLAYACVEMGCIAENVALQATSLRIGSACIGGVDSNTIQETMELPKENRVICLLPLGKS